MPEQPPRTVGNSDRLARVARLSPLLIAALGVLASALIYTSLRHSELAEIRVGLERQSMDRARQVERELVVCLETVRSTVAFFESSEEVTEDEFATFTRELFPQARPMRALFWWRTEGGSAPRVTALGYRAGPEAESLLAGSGEERLRRALGSAIPPPVAAGHRGRTAQVLDPARPARVLVAQAVADDQRVHGVVAGVLDLEQLLEAAQGDDPTAPPLRIEDHGPEEPRVLAGDTTPGERLYQAWLDVADRPWALACRVPTETIEQRASALPAVLSLVGLVGTLLLVVTVRAVTSRAHIQTLVERRTREVSAAYDTLAAEAQERLQAVRQAQAAEERLRQIIDLLPDMIYVKDWFGRYLLANEATAEAHGTTVAALTASAAVDMNADATEPDATLREERLLIDSQQSALIRSLPFVDAQGHRRILRVVKIPCAAYGPGSRALLCVASDVTSQRHAEAVLKARDRILDLMARGATCERVLVALVGAAEELVPDLRASVLVVSPDGRRLLHGAAPSLPADYNEAIDGLEIGPGVGCCGDAAHRGERVTIADVLAHPSWEPFRELARRAGIRACWSQPIRGSEGEILGTFAMYYREVREPEPYEEELMESFAHLAGIALDRARHGAHP